MAPVVEEKSMVPTVLVGIGGTGAEILSRVRRLVEEVYGGLKYFPVISFLLIDTDKDYKVTIPEAAGSPLQDTEKHWARVTGREVRDIVTNMANYPWIDSWFPKELERNLSSLEAGAGQIRACGRFALFCNYHDIQRKFLDATKRCKGQESYMLDRHGVKVSTNGLNVFITGSLSGGTGSGMLVDMGYCVREWLRGESSSLVTALVPMPNAFASINVGDRVLANGYAAMMELSYYSDHRTEYRAQFSQNLSDEIRSPLPPFDFTYLVGTKNGETEFNLPQIREMIAQNIFLDLTSDFAPHKRSIRDNIKGAWAQADPGGRGYPKNFMGFGLATIEIPISQIRDSLSHRLAQDLMAWWLNGTVQLPPQMLELVRGDLLKRLRLTDVELIADLSAAGDRPYIAVVSEWVNGLRNDISRENWLQCTLQGANVIGREQGKILRFISEFLQPQVEAYRSEHFRELSPDERVHGDFLKKMYGNRDTLIRQGREALDGELYRILGDRTLGPKFADAFLVTVGQVWEDAAEKFRREQDKVWAPNEINRQRQYEAALQEINEFKDKFGISKQDRMEQLCESALSGLEGTLIATIQRKARALGLEVITRLQEHIALLERRLGTWNQRLVQWRDEFERLAQRDAESADALVINGIKLFDRQELNIFYEDLMEQLAGASGGNQSRYDLGLDQICKTLSATLLQDASPLWRQNRQADEVMQLFDLTEIPEVQTTDFKEMVADRTRQVLKNAPDNSRLCRELAACDRLFREFKDDDDIRNRLRIAYNKSKPLIVLSRSVLTGQDAGFTPAENINVALLGGAKTSNPAAQKLLPLLKALEGIREDNIKPLGEMERHRLVFVREVGGFSLRCIDGMKDLRRSYQDWKGQMIVAKRAQLRGESRDLPIPVHLQKEVPFWDVFPEDPEVFKLVVLARVLGVLRREQNQTTQEWGIRYTQTTALGEENIDLAASWEEAAQVLEVLACRPDREEIQRQVGDRLKAAATPEQKQACFEQFMAYLEQRQRELHDVGGKDSPDYKREATILLETTTAHQLKSTPPTPGVATPMPATPPEMPPESVAPPKPAPVPNTDVYQQLKELMEMYKSGLLTEGEFQAAKQQMLGLDTPS